MADTPWTPGPYHTSPWGDGSSAPGTLNVLSKAAQTVIAKDIPEAEAKLFAAAPDMAEAHDENAFELSMLLNYLDGKIAREHFHALEVCQKRSLAMSAKAWGYK